jgi:hypothetical protein
MSTKLDWLTQEIEDLKEQGLYNRIRTIGSAQGAWRGLLQISEPSLRSSAKRM